MTDPCSVVKNKTTDLNLLKWHLTRTQDKVFSVSQSEEIINSRVIRLLLHNILTKYGIIRLVHQFHLNTWHWNTEVVFSLAIDFQRISHLQNTTYLLAFRTVLSFEQNLRSRGGSSWLEGRSDSRVLEHVADTCISPISESEQSLFQANYFLQITRLLSSRSSHFNTFRNKPASSPVSDWSHRCHSLKEENVLSMILERWSWSWWSNGLKESRHFCINPHLDSKHQRILETETRF